MHFGRHCSKEAFLSLLSFIIVVTIHASFSKAPTNFFGSFWQVQSPEVLFRQQQREQQEQQYANLPAALLGTLKRDKKPFTYTPGGVNLSEVLEARLQKRMERKKKYMEEMQEQEQEQENLQRRQLVISPTYNSPLNMYSMENALETLEVQAQMAARWVSFLMCCYHSKA